MTYSYFLVAVANFRNFVKTFRNIAPRAINEKRFYNIIFYLF